MRVVAIIPAHNEAERIGLTVAAVLGIPQVDEVLVVDDGSSDDTPGAARAAGARVLTLDRNLGKGGALAAGVEAVAGGADVVLFLDADLGPSAGQAGDLLTPIVSGQADMTVAVLPKPPGSGGFGLVKGLARAAIRKLGGMDVRAPLSGQRGLGARALAAALPLAGGYGAEVALTVHVLRAGLRVLEVDTTMSHAATGKDLAGFAHRGRQLVDVARAVVRLALEGRGRRA
jgi:glycosyltransferase involved in cell wall biosynthesis